MDQCALKAKWDIDKERCKQTARSDRISYKINTIPNRASTYSSFGKRKGYFFLLQD